MAYYFFDKCKKECLTELEKLAQEAGLTEKECAWKNSRFWSGEILEHEKRFYRELLINYSPDSQTPVSVQTNLQEITPKKVRKIIQELRLICQPTEIYKDPFRQLKYDLKEFED